MFKKLDNMDGKELFKLWVTARPEHFEKAGKKRPCKKTK